MDVPTVQLRTSASMPLVGFGTFRLSSKQAILDALSVGYRLIDTAELYQNERLVGDAIRESGLPRDDIWVTTKVWSSHHGYQECLSAFSTSLQKLQMDYVNLFLVHWPAMPSGVTQTPREVRKSTWKAMEEIYRSGRAKAIGVSNYTVRHLKELLEYAEIPPAVNQCEMHMQLQQRDLVEFCRQNDILFQSFTTLGRGANLTLTEVQRVAQKVSRTPAQVCLRYAVQQGIPVIPKSIRMERIRENFDIFSFAIEEDDMEAISTHEANRRISINPTDIE